MRRTWPTILTATGITLAVVVPAAPAASAASGAAPEVRVNQVGYPSVGPKAAFAMLAGPVRSVSFEVTTPYGVAYRGTSTDDVGSWNSAYRAVYRLNFSGLRVPGVYQVKVTSPAVAASPAFVVGTGAQLYRQLVDNAVQYFTSERDGPDVVRSVLGRQPANLTDEQASIYADPAYDTNDNLLALGANAWGSSFVVGAGTVFPHCMQSEIANLAGSLTGRGDIQLGATSDGPSSIGNFTGLGTVPGMRACSAGQFAPFNNAAAGYEDNVVSWPSVEPADDYTAASLFAFALGGAGLG